MYPKPIVLTDFHHDALLNSLILLFERRLGGTVFRPIGTEWNDQGFWKIFDQPDTVKQYLSRQGAIPNSTNHTTGNQCIYLCHDIYGETNKAITLDGFYQTPVDIVIASIPGHIEPFKRLCEKHPNHPKMIYQIGNAWPAKAGLAPNIMASASINDVPDDIHLISYHQEFDIKVFYPDFSYSEQNVYSFVHCFNTIDAFSEDWQLFQKVEKLMPDWNFKSYGGQCRDGTVNGAEQVAQSMKEARFIWHTKTGGDGYGHVIYNSAAVARPMIVKMAYYEGKLGKELMEDGKTCIGIDGLSPQEIVNKVKYYSDEARYETMCRNVYNNFKDKVNFDKEAEAINRFIKNLK